MKLPHERPGCAWLFASSGSRTMMEYYFSGGVLQYAFGHLTPIELLHVHRVREGERVAKASPRCTVDATHHSTGPTWLPLNLAERPAVYNTPFAATSNIYPPQIKIYIPVLTR